MYSFLRCGIALLAALSGEVACAQSQQVTSESILVDHKKRIELLKEAVGKIETLPYAIHTLIVPTGAVAKYNFPVPVARVRYETVPLFDFDDAKVKPEFVAAIDELVRQFRSDRTLAKIAIVGHTDSVGLDAYNYNLSLRRATAVANIFRLHGFSEQKIKVIGLGESTPIATNENEEGRALNRRVEFFLSSIPQAIIPSIRGTDFDPSRRNNHDPACKTNASGECGKTSITQFPTHDLLADGKIRPTGEVIVVDGNAPFRVQEIPEREHIPMIIETRPHVN